MTRKKIKIAKGDQEFSPGYHLDKIKKGEIGEASKIREELAELKDAEAQGVRIMALVELSDMYGAIYRYLEKHFPETTMEDLRQLSETYCRSQTEAGTSDLIDKELRAFRRERRGRAIVINRLARVYGAMELYLKTNFPGLYFTDMRMDDLAKMSAVTRRAFENGYR